MQPDSCTKEDTMATSSTDRVEKKITLRAPLSRVWRAITDAREFGAWFKVTWEGPFAPGARVRGKIDQPGFEHLTADITVERMDPERLFSYRWHPYAIDPKVDYSGEPTTLVEFHLQPVAEGTLLIIVESGFDQIPLARRAEAYRMNDQGWTQQASNIERYVAAAR
jgi:uncharacterized protein YndB with AHSA1/START domain